MPDTTTYLVLNQGGKSRILRTTPDGTATGLTSLNDADLAHTIATALNGALTDLPHTLTAYVLCHTNSWDIEDVEDWVQAPAPCDPLDLRRRALSVFDDGTPMAPPGTHVPNTLPGLDQLRAVLSDAPPSVIRAVRAEVAAAYGPYTGVPVLALAYDRKWDDVRTLFVANAGLSLLTDDKLAGLLTYSECQDPVLLDVLSSAGLADFTYAADTAEQGYLAMDVHAGQLAAWHAHRTTT